jgi:hypothetical protein
MANNFASRLDRVEAAKRRRVNTGPKLTRELPVILEGSDIAGIEAARAEGKIVWITDSPLPPGCVIM